MITIAVTVGFVLFLAFIVCVAAAWRNEDEYIASCNQARAKCYTLRAVCTAVKRY